ncbi:MAG: hemolysin family protein [Chlamydiia bacterium]
MIYALLALLALLGVFAASASMTALRAMSRGELTQLIHKRKARSWYQRLFAAISGIQDLDALAFSLLSTALILRALFVVLSAVLLSEVQWDLPSNLAGQLVHGSTLEGIGEVLLLLVSYLFIGDFLPRVWAHAHPEQALRICSGIALPYLLCLLPINVILLRMARMILGRARLRLLFESQVQSPARLLEAMEAAETAHGLPKLEQAERKLLSSAVTFRTKVAREVMVPRIKMFTLPERTSVQEAARVCLSEGYSRVPLYADTLDHVTGVLLVKELLRVYSEQDPASLQRPIGSLAKPVLFCPENKRISLLLQEFRARQVHLAIVVDEYGGTEGLLTIEDILEELVGDIGDEYDIDEEALFLAQPGGAWLVDAQMGILDIEDKLGVQLPQSAEYDTLGGFIFHKTGTIPQPGYRIHCDACDLEIVSSSERCVERVRIRLAPSHHTS